MTVKELQKLKRQELLQLLLTQSKEVAELHDDLEKATREIQAFEDNNERLNAKVHEKDALINKLSERLEGKEERSRELKMGIDSLHSHRQTQLRRSDSIAGATLMLNGLFEIAQQAADQYLYNIRRRCQADSIGGLKNNG